MKNKEVWDNIAKEYRGYHRKLWSPVKDFIKNNKGVFLDIGCGNFPTHSSKKEIIGLDISLEQLKLGKGKRVQGNMISLPFKSKTFDNVLFIASLHNIKQRKKALKEANRVLKNNGKIFISVWNRFQKRFFPKNLITSKITLPFGKYPRYYHLYSKVSLKKDVKHSGFEIIKILKEKNNIFLIGTKKNPE